MLRLKVEEMSCGHCVASVEKAVHSVDAGAHVAVDLAAGTVAVTGTAEEARVSEAIRAAGYPAAVID